MDHMTSEELEITIANDGSVHILVRGVKGKACLELTSDLEAALGGKIISRETTAEYGQSPEIDINQKETSPRVRTKRTSK
jgi:hypothetical protein